MIQLKTKEEIELMRQANRIVAKLLDRLKKMVEPGITTAELDAAAEEYILKQGAIPTFKGYAGYPACICTSVNEEVVHGIPGKRVLRDGDIVSIDAGVKLNGFCGDSTISVAVGTVSPEVKKLMKVTEKALEIGISKAIPGNRIGDIGNAVQTFVEGQGFSVIRDFVGHGIGHEMHEDPQVPHFGRPGTGPLLQEGMVIAIEPMVTIGSHKLKVLPDGWTAITLDGTWSAQYEHSVAITANGPDVHTGLKFTNMRVNKKFLLGKEGQGLEIAIHSLSVSRVHIAASNLGMAQRMLEISLKRAHDRVTFGKPIIDRQAIRMKIADMSTYTHALRTMVRDFAKDYEKDPEGEYIEEKAAMCKLFSIHVTKLVSDEMLEIFGGIGYFEDCEYGPVERLYRDARAMWLEEGTPTVQRITISRQTIKHGGVLKYED